MSVYFKSDLYTHILKLVDSFKKRQRIGFTITLIFCLFFSCNDLLAHRYKSKRKNYTNSKIIKPHKSSKKYYYHRSIKNKKSPSYRIKHRHHRIKKYRNYKYRKHKRSKKYKRYRFKYRKLSKYYKYKKLKKTYTAKIKKKKSKFDDWEIYYIPKNSFYGEIDDLEETSSKTSRENSRSKLKDEDWEIYFVPKNSFYEEVDEVDYSKNNSKTSKKSIKKTEKKKEEKDKKSFFNTIIDYGEKETEELSKQIPPEFFYKPQSENESTILLMRLGRNIILDETLPAYLIDNKVFLSLARFAKDLEFPIYNEEDLRGASGWFMEKKRLFTLDFRDRILLSGGKRFDPSPDEIKIIEDDIYVKLEFLPKLFPIKLDFDERDQTVILESIEQLPIEASIEREKTWEELSQSKELENKLAKEKAGIKNEKTPYKYLTLPVADIRYSRGFNKSKGKGSDENYQLNTLISGDLLKLNYQLFANISESKLTNARFTMNRKDFESKLLGNMQASEFAIGDTFTPQDSLISRGQFGSGASVTNFPDDYVAQFDKVLIRGTTQPNWDAELYRNNALMEFQKVGANGIYEFQNVALMSGLNIIKIVTYGPFGQRQEELRRFFVDNSNLKKNKFYYRFAFNKNNQSLINTQPSGTKRDPAEGLKRYFSEIAYGLNETTSLSMNYQTSPVGKEGDINDYFMGALRASLYGVYTNFGIARNLQSKTNATEMSVQTELYDYSITLKRLGYNKKYVSEQHQLTINPLIYDDSLRIDGIIPIPFTKKQLNTSFKTTRQYFQSKEQRYDVENDLSFAIGNKLNISQNFRFVKDERLEGAQVISTNGRTGFNLRATKLMSFRNSLAYTLKQRKELSSNIATVDYRMTNGLTLTLSHDYKFGSKESKSNSSYSASLGKTIKNVIMSLSSSYLTSNRALGINLNLSTSIGYDLKNKTRIISDAPLADSGIISARIFLDRNTNDIFDEGDEPLEGVGIEAEGTSANIKSNKDGIVILNKITANRPVKIKVKIEDLKDPYLAPRKTTVNLLTHSGVISYIDFPVYPSGEVSGYAMIYDEKEGLVPASNVKLEIIDKDNVAIKETESSYDGFYIFDMIPYGEYKIMVSEEQVARLGLEVTSGYKIQVNQDNQELKFDFNLKMKERPPESEQQNQGEASESTTANQPAPNTDEPTMQDPTN